MSVQILSSVIGSVATTLLGLIVHMLMKMGRRFDRFMGEHLWLLATTMWTRDNVIQIMNKLGMPLTSEPPSNLNDKKKR